MTKKEFEEVKQQLIEELENNIEHAVGHIAAVARREIVRVVEDLVDIDYMDMEEEDLPEDDEDDDRICGGEEYGSCESCPIREVCEDHEDEDENEDGDAGEDSETVVTAISSDEVSPDVRKKFEDALGALIKEAMGKRKTK